MVVEMERGAVAKGFKFTESNQELETNNKIQAQWKYFNPVQHKRKRIFKKATSVGSTFEVRGSMLKETEKRTKVRS